MMFKVDDDGVVSKVDAEELIYVDKNELDELIDRYNRLEEENEQLKSKLLNIEEDRDYYKSKVSSLEEGYIQLQDREIRLKKENEQLKQQIKDFRINVLDSIYEADSIKCNCNPCVVEEYVKKVVE